MKTKTRQAVLKLLLLQEEFTRKELEEAVEYISDNEFSDVVSFLRKRTSIKEASKTDSASPLIEGRSQVLMDLESKDPTKFELLSEFDSLLRKGELTPKMDYIKKVGASYSKEFNPGRSRKETIPRFITLLASLSIDQIRSVITSVIEETGSDESEYAALANYLIHGQSRDST